MFHLPSWLAPASGFHKGLYKAGYFWGAQGSIFGGKLPLFSETSNPHKTSHPKLPLPQLLPSHLQMALLHWSPMRSTMSTQEKCPLESPEMVQLP